MSGFDEVKEVDKINVRMSAMLSMALSATHDGEALAALAGLRRTLQSLGSGNTDLLVYRDRDGSRASSNTSSFSNMFEDYKKAMADSHRYRERLAILEKVLMEVRRITRPLPAADKADYRLRGQAERFDLGRPLREYVV